jgi:hypothetical protein
VPGFVVEPLDRPRRDCARVVHQDVHVAQAFSGERGQSADSFGGGEIRRVRMHRDAVRISHPFRFALQHLG